MRRLLIKDSHVLRLMEAVDKSFFLLHISLLKFTKPTLNALFSLLSLTVCQKDPFHGIVNVWSRFYKIKDDGPIIKLALKRVGP